MRTLTHIALAALALTMLSGWSWDDNNGARPFGDAYRMQLEAQKLNPEPLRPVDTPVTGLNGQVAQEAMRVYQHPTPQEKGTDFAGKMPTQMKEDK